MRFTRVLVIPLGALALSGCGDPAERFPVAEDFCEEEDRTLSDEEKKVVALREAYLDGGGPQYLRRYIDEKSDEDVETNQLQTLISDYLVSDPLCCQILTPDHLGNEVINDQTFYTADQLYFDRKWGYVADLFIFWEKDGKSDRYRIDGAFEKEDLRKGWALMVNNCGHFRGFDRG